MTSAKPILFVGNKNTSSWSMRPWLALKMAGVDFEERLLFMDTPEFKAETKKHGVAGKVPFLVDGDVRVWESLAICEYAAENFASSLWPSDKQARAVARSISNEMHAGFMALRRACSMNLQADLKGTTLAPEAGSDVHRVLTIWRECRERFGAGGPYLFGATFTIADAMFAPVCTRFTTYGVPADPVGQQYIDTIQALPAFIEWKNAALQERR
jgi:glutathione S-transferase